MISAARWLRALACAIALTASSAAARAQPAEPAVAEIDPDLPDAELRALREGLERERIAARAATLAERQRLEPLRRQIEALDLGGEGEDVEEVDPNAALRATLRAEIAEAEGALAAAQLTETRIELQLERIAALARERLRSRLITRGPSPLDPATLLDAADAIARGSAAVAAETARAATDPARLRDAAQVAPVALAAIVAGLALLRIVRRRVGAWTAQALAQQGRGPAALVGVGLTATLARFALPLAALALLGWGLMASGLIGPRLAAIVASLDEAALLMVAVYAFGAAYFAPETPALRVAALDDRRARKAFRRALGLAAVLAAEHVLLRPLYLVAASETALAAVNLALVGLGGVLMWRLQSCLAPARPAPAPSMVGDAPDAEEVRPSLAEQAVDALRLAMKAVALTGPALAAAGYVAASRALFMPFAGSLGVLGLALLAHGVLRVALGWRVGPGGDGAPAAARPRVAAVASVAALCLLALPALAVIWGADRADLAGLWRAAVEGVNLGAVRVVPLDLLALAAVFGAGWALTRVAQRVVAAAAPEGPEAVTGAREALISLMGYAGITLSAVVAVSAVGLDLSSFALVAGALSVGIGFGLNGFVNNFISGVILQIEQPIKVGDWIEVNGVHGLVRRITVRSTLIDTFDRAAYVVPNADLVSHPVTNFTHRNRIGRLILRLTVPYESDPRQVEGILREVHLNAPNSRRWPGTGAFLTNFGPSGYEFELRVILRDITTFVAAGSALRFEIADRLRAAGIAFAVTRQDVRLMPGAEGARAHAWTVDAGRAAVDS